MAIRVVFDSNVVVALLVFADPALADLAARWSSGGIEAIVDDETIAEFERVLDYPDLKLNPETIAVVRDAYRSRTTRVPPAIAGQAGLPRCRDPDDQKFLRLADRAAADWLLTRDKALLRLRGRTGFRIALPEELDRRSVTS